MTTGNAEDFGEIEVTDKNNTGWLFQRSRRFIIMSRLNVGNLFNENEDGAPVVSGISTFSSPNYFVPPSGSTAQRPSNPGEGMIRFNTDSGHLEYYSGELWVDVIVNNKDLGVSTFANYFCQRNRNSWIIAWWISTNQFKCYRLCYYFNIRNAHDFGDLTELIW